MAKYRNAKVDWDKVLLQDQLHHEMTSGELAAHFGINRSAVNKALLRRNLVARNPHEPLADWDQLLKVEKLHEKMTPEEIAKMTGAAVATVKRRIWTRFGSTMAKRRKKKAEEEAKKPRVIKQPRVKLKRR